MTRAGMNRECSPWFDRKRAGNVRDVRQQIPERLQFSLVGEGSLGNHYCKVHARRVEVKEEQRSRLLVTSKHRPLKCPAPLAILKRNSLVIRGDDYGREQARLSRPSLIRLIVSAPDGNH